MNVLRLAVVDAFDLTCNLLGCARVDALDHQACKHLLMCEEFLSVGAWVEFSHPFLLSLLIGEPRVPQHRVRRRAQSMFPSVLRRDHMRPRARDRSPCQPALRRYQFASES